MVTTFTPTCDGSTQALSRPEPWTAADELGDRLVDGTVAPALPGTTLVLVDVDGIGADIADIPLLESSSRFVAVIPRGAREVAREASKDRASRI